jgi:glycosyltransferase involved in cell wall biosynthesis
MKVCGFTFVRNAIKFDYPVIESIRSILPVCDEIVVAVGNSEDNTRKIIESIGSPRIKILNTRWDDTLREGGKVLATETNKAFDAIDDAYDWAFYIQADEVVHEKHLPGLKHSMERWKDDPSVEGLLFDYVHFYGSYDFIGDSRRWYRREVRIIRNDKTIRSFMDAQGFRKNGRPLNVKPADATMYHYGWVKPPESLQAKLESFHKLWHDEKWIEKNLPKTNEFDYSKIDSLERFQGTHPEVMKERITNKNWQFDFDPTKKNFSFISRFLHSIERMTGWRIGEYKNYRIRYS